jgi:hypothetical protein
MNFLDRLESTQAAEAKSFTLISEGEHTAQVTDVGITNSPLETKINVEFTITKGEFTGRKCWWSSTINEKSSDKAMGFIKGQICRMANVESTNGSALDVLANTKGNYVLVNIRHKAGVKDPSKTYLDVFVQGVTEDVPF